MSYVKWIDARTVGDGGGGGVNEELRGFPGEQVVAFLRAGAPQQACGRIEELWVVGA
jgi:hypothetical protein